MRLDRVAELYKARLRTVKRKACAQISADIVAGTPVDTGALRQSWTPNKGGPNFSNRGGSFTAVANSLEIGETFSLANGQPYARRIEYGHSPQAPGGMMRINVAQWPWIVASAARGI